MLQQRNARPYSGPLPCGKQAGDALGKDGDDLVTLTLLVSSIVVLAMGALYMLVGRAVVGKGSDGPQRGAREAFSLWWFAFAAATAVGGLRTSFVAFGIRDVTLHVTLTHLSLLILFVGLWGLMYYLLYLYSGSHRVGVPLAVFYGLFFLVGIYVVTAQNPVGLDVGQWQASMVYEREIAPVLGGALTAALVVPLVVGAVLYLLLYFKVDDPLQKTRILLVGGALVLWFGTSSVAVLAGLNDFHYWPLVSRLIALAAALIILYAFTRLNKKSGKPDRVPAHGETPTGSGG